MPLPSVEQFIGTDVTEQGFKDAQKQLVEYVGNEVPKKIDTDAAFATKANKATTLAGYGIADAYTKAQVDTTFAAYAGGRKAYTTLALAQAAQSSLPANTVVDVTNDPDPAKNGTYQWNGTTLTKSAYDPLTQAKEYATNEVNVLEDSLIVISPNLYDANTVTLNEAIAADGSLISDALTSHTDFIAVVPNQQYAVKATTTSGGAVQGFNYIAYYGANKNFIRRDWINNSEGADSTAVVTTPSNAYFIRLNMRDLDPFRYFRQINIGSAALPYEPYGVMKLKVDLSQSNIDQVEEELGTVKDYVQQSANLFDHTTCQDNLVILANGDIKPPPTGEQYAISDFIAVEANQQYTMSSIESIPAFISTAYYTADKTFIGRAFTDSSGPGYLTITIPSNAAYVRFNVNKGAPSYGRRMFNKGAEPLPYVEYGKEFTNAKLSKEIIEQIKSEIVVSPSSLSNPFVYDMPVDGVFNTNEVWDDYTDFRTVTSAHVYSLFDNLLASHSDYIIKQELEDDLYGNPISLYRFKAAQPTAANSNKIPKIFISCGLHGHEHVPPLAMYLLLEQMCNNWRSDPLLEALRHNVDLLIIPVANPSGFDDYTRTNRNGVDINRNFPVGWRESDPATIYYGGPSAASELETQNIISVFNTHKDIDIFYDFHNFSGIVETGYQHYIWIVPNALDTKVDRMAQALIARMTRKWQKELSFLPQSNFFCGYSSTAGGGGFSKHFATAQGVKFSATFEVCQTWLIADGAVSAYDATHCKTAVEAITNWLLINLNELQRI